MDDDESGDDNDNKQECSNIHNRIIIYINNICYYQNFRSARLINHISSNNFVIVSSVDYDDFYNLHKQISLFNRNKGVNRRIIYSRRMLIMYAIQQKKRKI